MSVAARGRLWAWLAWKVEAEITIKSTVEFVHLTCLPKRNNFRPRSDFSVRPPDNPAASPSFIFEVRRRRFYGQTRRNLLHWLSSIHIQFRMHYGFID